MTAKQILISIILICVDDNSDEDTYPMFRRSAQPCPSCAILEAFHP